MSTQMFSRERLAGYDQTVMENASVTVVGGGALGQNVALDMALSGVGEIRLIDKDIFEEHNRTRSPAYPLPHEQATLGLKKASAVAHKIRDLMTGRNPRMLYAHAWVEELGDGAFSGTSVVLSCVDRPAARAYLADKTRLLGLPLVEAGFDGPALTLSQYPATSPTTARTVPCWRCSHQEVQGAFSCRFYAQKAESLGIIPALQNSAATLGGLQSEAAIEILHGRAPNEAFAIDLNIRSARSGRVTLSVDPDCPGLHTTIDEAPTELNTGPEMSVGDLMIELREHLSSRDVRVTLPEPLVWEAPCTKTGRMTAVHAPYSKWAANPRCTDGGGEFEPISATNGNLPPLIFPEISPAAPKPILHSLCKTIGLPALSIITVETSQGCQHFRLGGSITDLFEEVHK